MWYICSCFLKQDFCLVELLPLQRSKVWFSARMCFKLSVSLLYDSLLLNQTRSSYRGALRRWKQKMKLLELDPQPLLQWQLSTDLFWRRKPLLHSSSYAAFSPSPPMAGDSIHLKEISYISSEALAWYPMPWLYETWCFWALVIKGSCQNLLGLWQNPWI